MPVVLMSISPSVYIWAQGQFVRLILRHGFATETSTSTYFSAESKFTLIVKG